MSTGDTDVTVALVLAGGGARGAYEAGALSILLPELERRGLLNAAFLAANAQRPAVHVSEPAVARGWYVDGGTRLNTPVKPAIDFGAQRIVVIALNSLAPGPAQLAGEQRPDALVGAGQILDGLLAAQLTADVQTMAMVNGMTRATRVVPGRKRRIPYIVISPPECDAIGKLALRVLRKHYTSLLQSLRAPDISLLTRLIAGASDAAHAELASYLLFAPEFAKALIRLGRADAKRWIGQPHEVDGLWALSPVTG
jgi:NTE family protein